jgi:hypothetical protein
VRPEQPDRSRERDPRTGADAPEARIRQQSSWVDLQIRQAVTRGDFEELPGLGKPIEGLTGEHDPDWWVKKLIEREQITGVLPPSLLVRKADAELDDQLDRLATEEQVRRAVEEFNEQVRWALYRPPEGPPVVTRQRVGDREVDRWRERRDARAAVRRSRVNRTGELDAGSDRPVPRWRATVGRIFLGKRHVSGKADPRRRSRR